MKMEIGRSAKLSGIFLALFACSVASLRAQEVSAALSQPVTQVGAPVQMNVTLTGINGAELPPSIDVDGLAIRFAGNSKSVNIVNLNISMSETFTYMVMPSREGNFTIPSLQIRSGNKRFRTEPLKLRVSGVSTRRTMPNVATMPNVPMMPQMPQFGAPPVQRQQQQQRGREASAFAEIQMAKTHCYVGETIPVKLKFLIEASVPCRINEPPVFRGEGFTTARLNEPEQGTEEINGVSYNSMTFDTSVTPVKSGEMNIEPITFNCLVNEGGGMQGNADDIFAQFAQMFGQAAPRGFGGARQIMVTSDPVKLNVKPLPSENKPASFSGAVGDFALTTDASPRKVGPGEPVTLKLILNGKGNFDAISAPVLMDTDGWRTYTPKEAFVPSEPGSLSGKKTFEYLLIAQEAKQMTPGAEFSYFNPALGKYVTLATQGVVVNAQAPNPSATPPPSSTVAATAATPSSVEPPLPQKEDTATIAPPIAVRAASQPHSFKSLVWDWRFLAAQGLALILLIALIAFAIWRRNQSGEKARRRELQKLAAKKLRQLSKNAGDRRQFYQDAAAYLCDETEARTGKSATEITQQDVISSAELDVESVQGIKQIFQSNEELIYGSAGQNNGDISPEERTRVVDTLQKFNTSHAS